MLKRFEDLNDTELVKLTEEEISNYIDMELLIKGFVPVEKPKPVAEVFIDNSKVKTGFKVHLLDNIIFKSMEGAMKFIDTVKDIDVFQTQRHYQWNHSLDQEYYSIDQENKMPLLSVEAVQLVDKNTWKEYVDREENNKAELSIYKEQEERYEEYIKNYNKIKEEITRKIECTKIKLEKFEYYKKIISYTEEVKGTEEAVKSLYETYCNNNGSYIDEFIDEYGYGEIIKKYQEQKRENEDDCAF